MDVRVGRKNKGIWREACSHEAYSTKQTGCIRSDNVCEACGESGRILLKSFIGLQDIKDDKEYLRANIAYWTAPTLAKLKPSNLVSLTRYNRDIYKLWENYKDEITKDMSLEYFEIAKSEKRELVLFYNKAGLENMLKNTEKKQFLCQYGYPENAGIEEYLAILSRRFDGHCPHEVGVFLGIPLEDIVGFITNKGRGCIFSGYWKVYHNSQKTQKLFDSFDKSRTDAIRNLLPLQYGDCFIA